MVVIIAMISLMKWIIVMMVMLLVFNFVKTPNNYLVCFFLFFMLKSCVALFIFQCSA